MGFWSTIGAGLLHGGKAIRNAFAFTLETLVFPLLIAEAAEAIENESWGPMWQISKRFDW